ncbi:MFS transporter [Nonomuraea ferruginea]
MESRKDNALVPISIFRTAAIGAANLVNVLLICSYGGMLFVLTLYLQTHLGLGALQTGLTFAVSGAIAIVVGIYAGRYVERFGLYRVLLCGIVIETAGILIMVGLPEGYGFALVLIGTSVNAFGHIIALVTTSIARHERRRGGAAGHGRRAAQRLPAARTGRGGGSRHLGGGPLRRGLRRSRRRLALGALVLGRVRGGGRSSRPSFSGSVSRGRPRLRPDA